MRILIGSILLVIGYTSSAPALDASVRLSCLPSNSEKVLTREARVLKSKAELDEMAKDTYQGAARLKGRVFWSEEIHQFVIPYKNSVAILPLKTIQSLQKQINLALKNKYADALVYPDLGHVHLLLPQTENDELKKIGDPVLRLEKQISSANLKGLYHTAEMIQLKDGEGLNTTFPQDAWKLWRYFSRNLIGTFSGESPLEIVFAGPAAIYNTVRSLPDMAEVEVLYFSSNHQGCFEFNGPNGLQYFDLTLETIPYQ